MTLTWCETTSCSSRAIRSRSSATASAARCSRSRSARAARSSTVPMYRRRSCAHVPMSHTTNTESRLWTRPDRPAWSPTCPMIRAAIPAAPAIAAAMLTRCGSRSATVNRATSAPMLELNVSPANSPCPSRAPNVTMNTGTGAIRRATSGTVWSRMRTRLTGSIEPKSPAPPAIVTSDSRVSPSAIRRIDEQRTRLEERAQAAARTGGTSLAMATA